MAFPPLGNSDHLVVSVSIDFPINSKHDTQFHHVAYDYSRADWDGLQEIFHGRISLNSVLLLLLVNFVSGFKVRIDVYSPHPRYQVKPHSSPWLSAACAAAIVHRNYFFHLKQQNKSSESKVKSRQASNHCKRVLEAAKFAFSTKTKVHHFPET